jgi:hypothetical protein
MYRAFGKFGGAGLYGEVARSFTDLYKSDKRRRKNTTGFKSGGKYVDRTLDEIPDKKANDVPKQMPSTRKSPIYRRKGGPRSSSKGPRTTRKRKLPVKRRSAKKRTFKKAKRSKPAISELKFSKRHFDDFSTISRSHCLYLGFQQHGSHRRMFEILAEAVAKALCAKMNWYPRSYDEPYGETKYNRWELEFKRVTVPGGVDDLKVVPITFTATSTLETIAAALDLEIRANANIDQFPSEVARYLDRVTIQNTTNPLFTIICKDVGETMITFRSSQQIKLQNLTPNDRGGPELDETGTNPLCGIKYEFNNHRLKLISEIQKLNSVYDVMQADTLSGVLPMMQVLGADGRLAHPPKAREVFTNCARSTPFKMAPGAFTSERTTFTMKHKLSTFIERIYYSGFDKGSYGAMTLFCLERMYRTVNDQGNLNVDSVKIGYNREVHMACHAQLRTQKSILKHYENNPAAPIDT